MKVSSYKDILFIEENINIEVLNQERFEIKTSGFGNQLKNLNDLKEQICIKIANSSQKYNIVYNFRYGQKQNIIALDDISLYASGMLAQIGNEDYEKLKKLIDSSSLSQQYLLKNQKFYLNMPVQVDKVALYKIKNKFVGQCKLVNFSEKEIREVKLELQSINSFGEISENPITFSISRKKEDSNFFFGDDKTIVFSEEDISNFKFKILSVRTDNDTYNYNEEDIDYIPRDKILSEIMSEEEFNYLREIKYKFLFNEKSIQYNSIIPFKYGNFVIDFDGEIRKRTDADNILSFINYIENDLHNDYEVYAKLEQEKELERIEKLKIEAEEKKQKQENAKKKIRLIMPKILIACVICLIGMFFVNMFNKNQTYKEAVNLYNTEEYYEALNMFYDLESYKDSDDYKSKIIDKLIFNNGYLSLNNAIDYLTLYSTGNEELFELCNKVAIVSDNEYDYDTGYGIIDLGADYYLYNGKVYANVDYDDYLGTIYKMSEVQLSDDPEYLIEINSKGFYRKEDKFTFKIGETNALIHGRNIYELEYCGEYIHDEEPFLDEDDLRIESKIDDNVYKSISENQVKNEIEQIKTYMSYRKKSKSEFLDTYNEFRDDGWNRLEKEGELFGVKGIYTIMYERDSNLVDSVGFDWKPDDMERHEAHMRDSIEKYFGNWTEVDTIEYANPIIYVTDWWRTTEEEWSVHLAMSYKSGWLQFSQLIKSNE